MEKWCLLYPHLSSDSPSFCHILWARKTNLIPSRGQGVHGGVRTGFTGIIYIGGNSQILGKPLCFNKQLFSCDPHSYRGLGHVHHLRIFLSF